MPDTLFTFQSLATLGGSAAFVFLVVQSTKELIDKRFRIPTSLYATAIGFIVLLAAQIATGANPRDWRIYFLALANGFLVAATAGKMRDSVTQEAK